MTGRNPIEALAHLRHEFGGCALAMAERLYDGGVNVGYPGLAHHPDRALFDELRCPDHGYGGYTGTLEQRWQQLKDALEEIEFAVAAGAQEEEIVGTNYERKYIKEKRKIHTIAAKRIN